MKKRVAIVIIILILFFTFIFYLRSPQTFPIKQIEIYGNVEKQDAAKIQSTISPFLNKNFFTVNVEKIQAVLQKINWIEKVNIQKKWPNRLIIYIIYAYPVATLNDKFFLNSLAEPTLNAQNIKNESLPKLYGNKKDTILMLQNLKKITKNLAEINIKVIIINCKDSFDWVVTCDNDMKIHLDTAYGLTRLQQFVKVYNKITNLNHKHPLIVDLRYNDGLAITWK